MIVRPGVNAVRMAAGLFALTCLSFWSPTVLWLVAAGMLVGVALAMQDHRVLQRRFPHVRVTRRLPAVVGRGEPFEISWSLTAVYGQPLQGELREELPANSRPRLMLQTFATVDQSATAAGQGQGLASLPVASISQPICLPDRGRYPIGPLWIRLRGPMGFLEGQQVLLPAESVRVLPETFASPERFRKEIGAEIRLLDKPVFTRQQGDGTDFESLREFRTGDDPRRIDWRATARMQRPIVRKFQIERHRDVLIAVDCGRLMGGQVDATPGGRDDAESPDATWWSWDAVPGNPPTFGPQGRPGTKLDCAVDAALLLGRTALQGGDRCGFALFDRQVRGYLPPVAGLPSLPALVDSVYDAAVDWGETDFAPLYATLQRRQSKRSLLVILSDVLDAATSEQFRGLLQRLSQRHMVLFAAVRTPLLNQIFESQATSLQDAAEQAVAYRLIHDREAALLALRHAGVHVLDVEPQRLTVPLINEFLRLRRGNAL